MYFSETHVPICLEPNSYLFRKHFHGLICGSQNGIEECVHHKGGNVFSSTKRVVGVYGTDQQLAGFFFHWREEVGHRLSNLWTEEN